MSAAPTAATTPMTPTDLDVSVVICTRNRARQLAEVLDSAAQLEVPEGLRWELLVVDNGSSDDTEAVIRSFADRLPVRYAREDTPGLSNARNHGVRAARGRYLCWTDDDVRMDRRWLAAYVEAFRRHPEAAIFGGRVLPRLEGGGAPSWFVEQHLQWPIACPMAYRDLGGEELPLTFTGNKIPFGANFAVRTAEQRTALYDPDLGVSPTHKRLGEEVDSFYRMMKAGATGWWVPGSAVHHLIPPGRQTASYLFEYFFLAGATTGYLRTRYGLKDNFMIVDGHVPQDLTIPRWHCYLRSARRYVNYRRARRRGDLRWLGQLADLGYYLGLGSYRSSAEKYFIGMKQRFE
ncbi:glycosyltransferase [Mitsuaria sp. GD03876]|uniref:glycosyltransferase n=1 Tax=Mitsuaria sp. GD03876 TaxID=2975399 RepID=UPI00244753B3|nr:glycosyltransferase [Mitsuaria sp. GD03876]MDH0868294.1 glycosyltransferase [Mitsuaria sp. GD03876]